MGFLPKVKALQEKSFHECQVDSLARAPSFKGVAPMQQIIKCEKNDPSPFPLAQFLWKMAAGFPI
jgi:hypothetical protein